jgi:hypothetical protein
MDAIFTVANGGIFCCRAIEEKVIGLLEKKQLLLLHRSPSIGPVTAQRRRLPAGAQPSVVTPGDVFSLAQIAAWERQLSALSGPLAEHQAAISYGLRQALISLVGKPVAG